MDAFKALVVRKTETGQTAAFETWNEEQLMPGDVTVDVAYSTVNYKDGLALTGLSPIIKSYPMIPGIDFVGTVRRSTHGKWKPGDKVILGGWGVGEGHCGGFAERARVNGDWLVALPEAFSMADAAGIGVAGYTSMLCVMALEEQGMKPGMGEVLVTGAAGGVGSVAIVLLARLGYEVVASTGRMEEEAFLKSLGAANVVHRDMFNTPVKPLAKPRWAGAVDSVGSITLANVISQMMPECAVTACGLAQGRDLPSNVAPFILRGVRLIGINSVTTPMTRRQQVWDRLARDLDLAKLRSLISHVALDDVPRVAEEIIQGKVRGRVVVDVKP